MATIPLVAYLATWYLNMSTDEMLIAVLLFQIENKIFEVHNYGPHFPLIHVRFNTW